MKPRASKFLGEEGFLLGVVMVFLTVLFIGAFASAVLTRTDVSTVNNLRNEKKAFYAAEAGATEALLRVSMKPGTASTTVDSNTFNPRIVPDNANANWKGYILFAGSGPVTAGSTLTTPTIQPASVALSYSATTTTDSNNPALQLAWEKNGAAIKRIGGHRVLDITSTGQSGTARRTVTLAAISTSTGNSAVFLANVCKAVDFETANTWPGAIQVNSTCTQNGNNEAAFHYTTNQGSPIAPDINIVAPHIVSGDAYDGTFTPTPATSQPPMADPFDPATPNALHPLSLPTIPSGACQPFPSTPTPGVKYCGATVSSGTTSFSTPGTYIIDGPLVFSNSARVTGSGVTLYITNNGSITLGGASPSLIAPSSGSYAGVLIFQDRTNANPIRLTGSFSAGSLDGLIYAKSALVDDGSSGTSKTLNVEMVTAGITLRGGQASFAPPSTPLLSQITFQPYQQTAWKDF